MVSIRPHQIITGKIGKWKIWVKYTVTGITELPSPELPSPELLLSPELGPGVYDVRHAQQGNLF